MAKTFREWNVEQSWLLPSSVMNLVPADHVAHFVHGQMSPTIRAIGNESQMLSMELNGAIVWQWRKAVASVGADGE